METSGNKRIVFKPEAERICTICDTGDIGDEYHYIMRCPVFLQDRIKLLPSILNDTSPRAFIKLLKNDNINVLRGLAKFLKILFDIFD